MLRTPDPASFSISERLAETRKRLGWRQEDVVDAARSSGLSWTRATVASLESGRRRLDGAEMLLLTAVYEVPLSEILCHGGGSLELTPGLTMSCESLNQLLALMTDKSVGGRSPQLTKVLDELIINGRRDSPTELEFQAARDNGVAVEFVQDAARSLFGCRLHEERDRAVAAGLAEGETPSPERLRALRGHAARRLLERLHDAISDTNKGEAR